MASTRIRGHKLLLDRSDTSMTEDSSSLKHSKNKKRFMRCSSKHSSQASQSKQRSIPKYVKQNRNTQNIMPAYTRLHRLMVEREPSTENKNEVIYEKLREEELTPTPKKIQLDAKTQRADKAEKTMEILEEKNSRLEKKVRKLYRQREFQKGLRKESQDKLLQLQVEVEELQADKIQLLTQLQASEKEKNSFFRQFKQILDKEKHSQFQTAREASLHYQLLTLKKHIEESKSENQTHLQQIILNLQAYIQSYNEELKSLHLQNHIMEHQVQHLENGNVEYEKKNKKMTKQLKNTQLLLKGYKEDYQDLKKIYERTSKKEKQPRESDRDNSLNLSISSSQIP